MMKCSVIYNCVSVVTKRQHNDTVKSKVERFSDHTNYTCLYECVVSEACYVGTQILSKVLYKIRFIDDFCFVNI